MNEITSLKAFIFVDASNFFFILVYILMYIFFIILKLFNLTSLKNINNGAQFCLVEQSIVTFLKGPSKEKCIYRGILLMKTVLIT